MVENHYAFLGVSIFASPAEIQTAVDRQTHQAKQLQADAPEEAQEIEKRVRRIEQDLLSGTAPRAVYDERLFAQETHDQPAVLAPQTPAAEVSPGESPSPAEPAVSAATAPEPQPEQNIHGARFPQGGPLWAVAFMVIGAIFTLVIVFALSRRAGSSSTTSTPIAVATTTAAPQQTSVPATGAPTSPAVTQPTIPSPPDPIAVDRATIQARGFTPSENQPASTPDGSGKTLYAWKATCSGSVDGHCQEVFFFLGARFLGTDTANPSRSLTIVAAVAPRKFAVTYGNYGPQDPECCPSGKPVTITYAWNGSKLVPSGKPPGH
jgi:LppP/LprE lipoprotein